MALLLQLLACASTVPKDPDAPDILNALSGTVVVSGPDVAADTIMVLYNADRPPPPAGTGAPVSFATIPASAFTGDGAGGVRSAPWALTEVPDGDWLISALVDVDGNFNPITTSNSGATCGDWSGGYYTSLTSGIPAVVSVAGGELLDEITVTVGREVAIQRPAFEIVENDTTDATIDMAFGSTFQLQSVGVHSEIYELEGPYDGTEPCDTAFWFYSTDADGDGLADAHPNATLAANGAKDFWPRVYLRNSAGTPPGEFYGSEAISATALFGGGLNPVNTPTPSTTYDLLFPGAAVYVSADGTQTPVSDPATIPRGEWSITVVQFTGQLWTLPNVLVDFPAADASFDPALQGMALTIE